MSQISSEKEQTPKLTNLNPEASPLLRPSVLTTNASEKASTKVSDKVPSEESKEESKTETFNANQMPVSILDLDAFPAIGRSQTQAHTTDRVVIRGN